MNGWPDDDGCPYRLTQCATPANCGGELDQPGDPVPIRGRHVWTPPTRTIHHRARDAGTATGPVSGSAREGGQA